MMRVNVVSTTAAARARLCVLRRDVRPHHHLGELPARAREDHQAHEHRRRRRRAQVHLPRHSVQVRGRRPRPVPGRRQRHEGRVARPQGPDELLPLRDRRPACAAHGLHRLPRLPADGHLGAAALGRLAGLRLERRRPNGAQLERSTERHDAGGRTHSQPQGPPRRSRRDARLRTG